MTMLNGSAAAIAGYAADAANLAARYDALPVNACYAPVLHLIPTVPSRVIDIGSGTGRDAIWFADMGHHVTAVEPVADFPDMIRKRDERVAWLIDALPGLPRVVAGGGRFNYINLAGVWQHLDTDERLAAAPTLRKIAAPGALLIVSLRNGPAPVNRPAYPICADSAVKLFADVGFRVDFRVESDSIQLQNRAAGVRWTWLAMRTAEDHRHEQ